MATLTLKDYLDKRIRVQEKAIRIDKECEELFEYSPFMSVMPNQVHISYRMFYQIAKAAGAQDAHVEPWDEKYDKICFTYNYHGRTYEIFALFSEEDKANEK